jgi:hypothetical protein
MLGLAANNSMEHRASNNTQRPSNGDHAALPPLIKDELDDRDLFNEEEEDHDDGSYRPRPQLSQPNVHMRSLASLISERE